MTVRRKYPKLENMKTLICEQVRPDLNQKLSLLGVYAGDTIIFLPSRSGEIQFRLQGLAFVFIFKDGDGLFECKFSLTNPDGEETVQLPLDPLRVEKGKSAACIVQIGNIRFGSEGTYQATLSLERKKYTFDFVVLSKSAQAA